MAFTGVYLLALAGMALFGSRDGLMLTLLIVGPMWLGLSMGVIFNWQFLTLHEDRLLFQHYWKKHWVPYRDIRGAEVVETTGTRTGTVMSLYLHHSGTSTSPLKVNFKLFSAGDRTILLKTIKEAAPEAVFNDEAEGIRTA
jgi:hypothetical protein